MRDEARRLAGEAGEAERWRFRVVDVFWPNRHYYAADGRIDISQAEREEPGACPTEPVTNVASRGGGEGGHQQGTMRPHYH
ncbi:MAG: hypothetical protein JOZ41_06675 [Chloroflexi bacterium]|nr:hypothetical protein [Chloroflexota bacterium]